MTESFKVASLREVQLTWHQGCFIEKLDLGDAFFECPFQSPSKSCLGATGKENYTSESQCFSSSFGSRTLNGTPRTSCLAFWIVATWHVNHHRQWLYITFIKLSSPNSWQAQRNYINHFSFMWFKKFLEKLLLPNRVAPSGKLMQVSFLLIEWIALLWAIVCIQIYWVLF